MRGRESKERKEREREAQRSPIEDLRGERDLFMENPRVPMVLGLLFFPRFSREEDSIGIYL